MPTIRTIFQPDVTREVDDQEAAQLGREGLLLPLDDAPAQTPKPGATVTAAPTGKEANPDGGKQGQ